jgi:hypothetical protein
MADSESSSGETILGFIFVLGLVMLVAWGCGFLDESSGHSDPAQEYIDNKYTPAECEALRITALSDSPDAEDALVQWDVYC